MTLSILCPSARVGGLDILTDSLRTQTNQDFELLLLDALHDYRAPLVGDRLGALPFPVRHLATGGMALSNYCEALNHGVVEARGDAILIVPDFSWLAPDCVAAHAAFHRDPANSGKCLMADYDSRLAPDPHPSFPGYAPDIGFELYDPEARYERAVTEAAERYEADLRAGKLDGLMWGLFTEPLTAESVAALPHEFTHTKFGVEWGWPFCSLKCESFATETLVALNGFDEDLDGSHLYQDHAFSQRLVDSGYEWARIENVGKLTIVNPRRYLNAKRVTRPMRTNEAIAAAKRAAGIPINPHFSLRERRAARG